MKITRATTRKRDKLERVRRELLDELNETLPFCRGTLSPIRVKCGKPGCACGKDPAKKHGPYFQWTVSVNGKLRKRTLRPEQADIIRIGIARYKTYKKWSGAFEQHMEDRLLHQQDLQDTRLKRKKKRRVRARSA